MGAGKFAPKTEFDCARLLESDEPQARVLLYQRLLYSRRTAEEVQSLWRGGGGNISAPVEALLRTVDFARLTIEQRARLKNLSNHLSRTCAGLQAVLPVAEMEEVLARFVDSADFWLPRGRTLAENFCLFVYGQLSPVTHSLARDVARLDGIISGLSSDPDAPSPWAEHGAGEVAPTLPGSLKTESFIAEWHIIDADGNPPTADNLQHVTQPGPCRILVARFPNNQIILMSLNVQQPVAAQRAGTADAFTGRA